MAQDESPHDKDDIDLIKDLPDEQSEELQRTLEEKDQEDNL